MKISMISAALVVCGAASAFAAEQGAATPAAAPAAAKAKYVLTIKDHKFDPAELKIPANTAAVLQIKNLDADAEEFDSDDLKTEKVVAGKSEGSIHLKPLKPGRYAFEGEYHSSTAHGILIAE